MLRASLKYIFPRESSCLTFDVMLLFSLVFSRSKQLLVVETSLNAPQYLFQTESFARQRVYVMKTVKLVILQ